mmetsp:Transcript_10666/g.23174  ORF Transcript_10666/g.23174 Transcript_10666/m.23174 type:complete len:135 (-) Transcript_10666:17-421(-)
MIGGGFSAASDARGDARAPTDAAPANAAWSTLLLFASSSFPGSTEWSSSIAAWTTRGELDGLDLHAAALLFVIRVVNDNELGTCSKNAVVESRRIKRRIVIDSIVVFAGDRRRLPCRSSKGVRELARNVSLSSL